MFSNISDIHKKIYNYQLWITQNLNHTIWFKERFSDELSIKTILSDLDFSEIYFDDNTGQIYKGTFKSLKFNKLCTRLHVFWIKS